jgi:hypothetical protein
MEQVDERIMEFIREEGWASPSILASQRGFEASEGRIRERCKMLTYTGFLAPIAGELYDITTEGILYLDGKIDARHQPTPTVARVLRP